MPHDAPALSEEADHVLEGDHLPPPEPETSPECMLFKAVIARVWMDAFVASDAFLIASSDGGKKEDFDPEYVRGEARRWLVLDFGDWKKDRETICHLADIDPELVRLAAKRKLQQLKENTKPAAEIVSLDAAFAALIENESTMDSAQIDKALSQLAALEAA